MKNLKSILALAVSAGVALTACTKADRSDDFPKGDPPPVSGGYTNSRQIEPASLVGYWSFDGNLVDSVTSSVGTNHGMTYSAGLKGQALTGGPNSNKALATAPTSDGVKNMTQYTISLWVNSTQNDGATGLVSITNSNDFWANINIFLENGGSSTLARFKTIFQVGTYQADNGIQDVQNGFGKWTQYTISYDGAGKFRSYVNGTLAAEKTTGTGASSFNNVGPIVFGALHFMVENPAVTTAGVQGWAGYLPGKMDEVRIYNKALTANQVLALSILERQGR